MDNKGVLYEGNIDILSKEEIIRLFKDGSSKAKEEIFKKNLKLVLSEVYKKFKYVDYDKEDLVSVGNIGLIKAVNTFNIDRECEFSTYAIKCIDNEILLFLRRNKKHQNIGYLDEVIYRKDNSFFDEICLKDKLASDFDVSECYEKEELREIFYTIINNCLSEKERKIIILCFGFNDNIVLKQKDVAKMFNCSQSYVSKILKKSLKKIKVELEKMGYIETSNKTLKRVK